MRVLVTGGSGLVGAAAVARLREAGHDVVPLARSERPDEAGLAVDLAAPDARKWLEALGRFDAVVHAAAHLSRDVDDPHVTLTNCVGTQQLLSAARRWECRSLCFISGVTVIGTPRSLPITEHHPTAAPDVYLASKLFGEQLFAHGAGERTGACSLRLSAPIGPLMPRNRILPVFVDRALAGEPLTVAGRGTRRQDYVDVADVARAIEAALERRASGVFNVAGGRSISNVELAELCVRLTGSDSQVELHGNDAEEGIVWDVSIERARAELGYEPQVSLEDSIRAVAGAATAARAA